MSKNNLTNVEIDRIINAVSFVNENRLPYCIFGEMLEKIEEELSKIQINQSSIDDFTFEILEKFTKMIADIKDLSETLQYEAIRKISLDLF